MKLRRQGQDVDADGETENGDTNVLKHELSAALSRERDLRAAMAEQAASGSSATNSAQCSTTSTGYRVSGSCRWGKSGSSEFACRRPINVRLLP